MQNNILIRILISISTLLFLVGCPKPPDPTEERDTSIHIELMDIWTTSATLKISVEDTTQSWAFVLSRNDSVVLDAEVWRRDTTIVDDNLSPNTDYLYMVYFLENSEIQDSSLSVNATTLDTSSHAFTWEIDTLGLLGSRLNDVAIIDENDIWVVGIIYMPDPDSSYNGSGQETFNAAHWNGLDWEMHRIVAPAKLHSIRYFSESDIWVSAGIPIHWNGTEWIDYHLWNMGILGPNDSAPEYCWGYSSNNMFFVGDNGLLVHWDGSVFTKLESGTDICLTDGINISANHYFVGGFNSVDGKSILLEQEGARSEILYEHYGGGNTSAGPDLFIPIVLSLWYSPEMETVWGAGPNGVALFPVHAGEDSYISLREQIISDVGFSIYANEILGQSRNDVMVIGYENVIHWNGVSWKHYDEIANHNDLFLKGIDMKDDFVVLVGNELWQDISAPIGIVIRGYR